MNCPKCKSTLSKDNINIHTDIAQCPNCNHIFKLSDHVIKNHIEKIDLNNPPNGVWINREVSRFEIGASTRSPIAFFMVPFMLVWTGGSLGGIYGTQIMSGDFDLMLSLFGIPFILGALIFWVVTFMVIWGKIVVTLEQHGGRIFTGIGSIGKTKRFNWGEITSISETHNTGYKSRNQGSIIEIKGTRRITFGLGLSSNRKAYLLSAMQQILHKVKTKNNLY